MPLLSARETAYQTIRSRIITMELKPGDPLNDRELAEELGISRTPMREALLMLNLARMVDIKPQSGTHVAPINLKLMEMEQFARYTLEKEILNRLRGHVTPQQEAEYRRNIEDYRVLEADLTQPDRPTRLLELAAPLELPPPSAREQQFQALWTQFYKTLEIKARHNEKGRMTHCPKRFWADMVEMQGEL